MKKLLMVLGLLLVVTGCTNKDLKNVYDNMVINENLTGYRAIIDIDGEYQGKRVRDKVYINNYNNTDLEITQISIRYNLDEDRDYDNTLYYVDGVMYRRVDDQINEYEQVDETTPYTNTQIFLDSIIETSKATKSDNETIADTSYTVYNIVVKKDTMQEILKYTSVPEFPVEDNVEGKVYIDSDNRIYRIEMEINTDENNELEIVVDFDKFNSTHEINIEDELIEEEPVE